MPFTNGTTAFRQSSATDKNVCLESSSSTGLQVATQNVAKKESKPLSRDIRYYQQLKTLNENFVEWIQKHLSKSPYCNFTPVFQDYEKYVKDIEKKFDVQNLDIECTEQSTTVSSGLTLSSESTSTTTSTAVFNFGFCSKTNEASKITSSENFKFFPSVSSTTSTKTFSFGLKTATESTNSVCSGSLLSFGQSGTTTSTANSLPITKESNSIGFSFKTNNDPQKLKEQGGEGTTLGSKGTFKFFPSISSTTSTSTFSFGMRTAPESTNSVSSGSVLSYGQGDTITSTANTLSTAKESGFTGFSFKANSGSEKSGDQDKNENSQSEEENEQPPKTEFTRVEEKDAVYSKRCKLFYKKGGSYVDKGIGTLYVKMVEETSQLLVRADTNLGNILLNVRLSSSLPMERVGNNNVLIVCIPNPPIDPKTSTESTPFLIRVKNGKEADELLEKLNQYKS
ncbi:nuclear pore complex protein Nup50-like isoform X2 [Limulus polyphemus]|nr:nuclear pore complex protein Nup50-like isoform X2 [Limulus polyphemus]